MSCIRFPGRASVVVLGLLVAACTQMLDHEEPTPYEALPAPGRIHLVSSPPEAPYPMKIRYVSGGDASRAFHEFQQGEAILVVFSNLPGQHGIEVNGQTCEGRYTLETGFETDLLLVLTDGACKVHVLGSHLEGAVHSDAPTDPKLD